MTLAEKCGIRVPTLHLQSIGKKDVLLVRRFDREKTSDGWRRTGFISALSLMMWDEADRLDWGYGAIADTMRRCSSTEEIHELFSRMVFNILTRNTDDHPRNHGFLFDDSGVGLSPAYDIVPSISRPGVGTDFNLTMSVGERGRESDHFQCLESHGTLRVDRYGCRKYCRKADWDCPWMARPFQVGRLPGFGNTGLGSFLCAMRGCLNKGIRLISSYPLPIID